MKPTEIAAWWGAVIGTAVLVWDIIKYSRSGVRLRVKAMPGMNVIGIPGVPEDQFSISVEASNISSQSTTITHLCLKHYKNLWNLIRAKHSMQGVVMNPATGRLPHVLEPGTRWTGLINQDNLVRDIGFSGYLYCGIYHSSKSKPIMVRVRLKPPA